MSPEKSWAGAKDGSGVQPERVVHRMAWLGKPARAFGRHVEMVFQADAELTRHADHRLVAEAHALGQRRVVTADQVRAFVDVQANAMAGAVRQAWQLVARA